MDNDTLSAVDSMARIFTHMFERACGFEDFEGEAMDACMDVCAAALAAALERFDRSFLDGRRPAGAKVHDVRERTLLCECGQVTFRRRRFELADSTRFFALDEALGLAAGSRVCSAHVRQGKPRTIGMSKSLLRCQGLSHHAGKRD